MIDYVQHTQTVIDELEARLRSHIKTYMAVCDNDVTELFITQPSVIERLLQLSTQLNSVKLVREFNSEMSEQGTEVTRERILENCLYARVSSDIAIWLVTPDE